MSVVEVSRSRNDRTKSVYLFERLESFSCFRFPVPRPVGMWQPFRELSTERSSGKKLQSSHVEYASLQTMSTLLGRPNLIIFVAPGEEETREKAFVDATFLLESAARILLQVVSKLSSCVNLICRELKPPFRQKTN